MLKINNINTGYDKKQILFDLSINVDKNEIVSVIGPNGSGKTTILNAIFGIVKTWDGKIEFDNNYCNKIITSEMVSLGISYAPQGNRVFDELTVIENLEIGGFQLSKNDFKEQLDRAFLLFPILKTMINSNAGNLSGGEQQMLSLARALMPKVKLLLLDEPSLGLAPNLLNNLFENIKKTRDEFGISILIVEQKVMDVLSISDRVYSIKLGKVAFEGKPDELMNNKEKLKELFL